MTIENNSGIDAIIRRKIVGTIKAFIPDAKIYLFGSRARGDFRDRSDIDIALDTGKKLKRGDVGEVRDVLNASNISYKIEVLDINGALEQEMRDNILKDWVLWKD